MECTKGRVQKNKRKSHKWLFQDKEEGAAARRKNKTQP